MIGLLNCQCSAQIFLQLHNFYCFSFKKFIQSSTINPSTRGKLNHKVQWQRKVKMLLTQFCLMCFFATSCFAGRNLMLQVRPYRPELEKFIKSMMAEINSRDSEIHDVAIVSQLQHAKKWVPSVLESTIRSIPSENPLTVTNFSYIWRKRYAKKANVIIIISDDGNEVIFFIFWIQMFQNSVQYYNHILKKFGDKKYFS